MPLRFSWCGESGSPHTGSRAMEPRNRRSPLSLSRLFLRDPRPALNVQATRTYVLPNVLSAPGGYLVSRYPEAAGAMTSDLYDGGISLRFLRGTVRMLTWCRNRLR